MTLRTYTRIWIGLALMLAYEAWALNTSPYFSFFALLKENLPVFANLRIDPSPGRPISLLYGWIGAALMLLTNLYIMRKHLGFLSRFGNLSGWLNLHIFFGLSGPTFILFHSNFKVNGLVAISFWSMVIVFLSGIIGRYFYIQLSVQREELARMLEIASAPLKSDPKLADVLPLAATLAGAPDSRVRNSLLKAFFLSLFGDLLLTRRLTRLAPGTSPDKLLNLRSYAINSRKLAYLETFRKLMGYWHSFHLPFAVFMYVVAVVHIAVALLFKSST